MISVPKWTMARLIMAITQIIASDEEFDSMLDKLGEKKLDRMTSPDGNTVYAITQPLLAVRRAREVVAGERHLVALVRQDEPDKDNDLILVNAFEADKYGIEVLARGLICGHAYALVWPDEYKQVKLEDERAAAAEKARKEAIENFFDPLP